MPRTLPAILLCAAALVFVGVPIHGRASAGTISEAALEATYGIRVTQIAVTGGGGLVDFRFTVVDPAKARSLLADHARMPRLFAVGTAVPLEASHGAMRGIRLQKDATSFLLFPNARGAIHPGTPVSVHFGDVRLEPIAAK